MKKRALLSVSDKAGIQELGKALVRLDYEILSTGGTAKALRFADVPVTEVSEVTGAPEILDGRVKTLHPKIHGAILARGTKEHLGQLEEQDIAPIDLVVVNLYPFEATVAKPGATLQDAIENIDIGGPTLIRAAAKNSERVAVVVDPADYDSLVEELEQKGEVSGDTRRSLARKAFARTAAYDASIANWMTALNEEGKPGLFPDTLTLQWSREQVLRYGENPHQVAALYKERRQTGTSIAFSNQLQGKQLSYNNLLDLDAALGLLMEFDDPAVCILKHNNPCGVATAKDSAVAFRDARAGDPTSAFGSIVGVNRPVDFDLAQEIVEVFVEAVVAPSFEPGALEILSKKKNLRLLEVGDIIPSPIGFDARNIRNGLLLQSRDTQLTAVGQGEVVSQRKPTDFEKVALDFAWRVAKHVKSNAIVLGQGRKTVGIGAGQMSRVDAVRIAAQKAGDRCKDSVLASDAFFPFADGVQLAADSGVTAIVQPGGSVRDEEVISVADERGLIMIFMGERHFRH